MGVRKHLGVVAVCVAGSVAVGCGLDATGDIATGVDAGLPQADTGVTVDAHEGHKPGHGKDASPVVDATVGSDGGLISEAGPDSSHDAKPHADVASPHDASKEDSTVHPPDAGEHHDAGHDAGKHDAGHDSGHDSGHDAGVSMDAGVVVTQPPSNCGFLGYSCGSHTCSCNQVCDDDTTCGACLPHFGYCLTSCDTDFSSPGSCGGCTNNCYISCRSLSPSCNLSGGTYTCGC